MVQALVELDEFTNRVLNIVKATYGFKDKGETIEFIVQQYAASEDIPGFKPEFIKKILAMKEKSTRVDINELFERVQTMPKTRGKKNHSQTREKKRSPRKNSQKQTRTTVH